MHQHSPKIDIEVTNVIFMWYKGGLGAPHIPKYNRIKMALEYNITMIISSRYSATTKHRVL